MKVYKEGINNSCVCFYGTNSILSRKFLVEVYNFFGLKGNIIEGLYGKSVTFSKLLILILQFIQIGVPCS